MSTAAYNSTVRATSGTTTLTNEATTKVTANTVYQITDTTKRILDPNFALTVEVDADGGGGGGYATAAADTYTVDYLFGKVTFASDQGGSATVRVSGKYYATFAVLDANEFSMSLKRDLGESTIFVASGGTNEGYKTRTPLLFDVSGEIGSLSPLQADFDTTGTTLSFSTLYAAGTTFLLEIMFGGVSTEKFRGWVKLESTDEKSSVGGLYGNSLKWVGAPFPGSGQTELASWGFGL